MDRHRAVANYVQERSQSALQMTKPAENTEPATDADFKSYVLYVDGPSNRSALCIKCLDALSSNPAMKKDTLIQVVESLAQKPTWLQKTPCLVIKDERRALKEDACVAYILENKTKERETYSRQKKSYKKAQWTLDN